MNRIESAATHQVSNGSIEPLAFVTGTSPVSCTPLTAVVATAAWYYAYKHLGFDSADHDAIVTPDSGRLETMSSSDLVTTSLSAWSGR